MTLKECWDFKKCTYLNVDSPHNDKDSEYQTHHSNVKIIFHQIFVQGKSRPQDLVRQVGVAVMI